MPTRSLPCYSSRSSILPELVERWVFIRNSTLGIAVRAMARRSRERCAHSLSNDWSAHTMFFARDVAQHLRCPRPRTCQIMNVRWRGRGRVRLGNLYMPLPQPLLRAVVLDVNLREPRAQHITPRPRLFGIVVKGKIQKVTFRVDGKKHRRGANGVEDIARGFGALFERLPKGCQKGDREFRFRR